ncbi:2-C-methyl-D-erythritol 2,4-cyclodiphosphate synthase [Anaerotruncus colihominis]|uniref:2-C-methyl-D-erythritol 2,4-cyclodiphosphate synthase n=1 Tax=Anaerotruncus colihominis TaxID=169435 RepID=UPI0034E96AD8
MKLRIGHGYDAHRFAENRKLIIGGVQIPYTRGLDGHSDADVLAHAVMDALLGALALGDIGSLFPDSDPAYAGADSVSLLVRVADLIGAHGWHVGNIDATVIAQAPRLKPYIEQMRARIAKACGMCPEDVSVKATTEEHMGFTGREEGISAHAVCLLERIR